MLDNLSSIFLRHKYKIVFTYSLMFCEFTLDALMPLLLGRAIDALLNKETFDFYLFIILGLSSIIIGVARRRIDTRTFINVFKDNALSSIEKMLAIHQDRAKIISRSHLIRTYGDFLEYTLPSIISSIIEICVSLFMLWYVIPTVSYFITGMIVCAIIMQKIVSDMMMKHERSWQEAAENIDRSILNGDFWEVKRWHDIGCPHHIQRSDIEAFSWNALILMCVITEIVVIYTLTSEKHSAGSIVATVSYCRSVFNKTNFINFLFNHLRQMELSQQLINKS